jgi:hypothetical protein
MAFGTSSAMGSLLGCGYDKGPARGGMGQRKGQAGPVFIWYTATA